MPVLYAVLVPPRSPSPPPAAPSQSPPKNAASDKKSKARTLAKAGLIAALLTGAGVVGASYLPTKKPPAKGRVYNPNPKGITLKNMQMLGLGHPMRPTAILNPKTWNHARLEKHYSHLAVKNVVPPRTYLRPYRLGSAHDHNAEAHARLTSLVRSNRLAVRSTYAVAGELASIYNKIALCKSTQVFADADERTDTDHFFFDRKYFNILIDADRVAKNGRLRGTYKGDAYAMINPVNAKCTMRTSPHTWQELANFVKVAARSKPTQEATTEAVMDLHEKDIVGLLINVKQMKYFSDWPPVHGQEILYRSSLSASAAWQQVQTEIGKCAGVARKFKKANPMRNVYFFSPKTNKLKLIRDKKHFMEVFEQF